MVGAWYRLQDALYFLLASVTVLGTLDSAMTTTFLPSPQLWICNAYELSLAYKSL